MPLSLRGGIDVMSIAAERLRITGAMLSEIERDARGIAKEHGLKVRKNPRSGIDVKFPDGEQKRFLGWVQLRNTLIDVFDLAD